MKNNELEFETLKSNKNRLYLLCGIVCVVVLLITIIVSNTFAKYRVTDTVPLINGEINYKVPDLNMVSLYVANEEGAYIEEDVIPTSGYTLNTEQSYCGQSNNGEIVKDDTVNIVYENGLVNVLGITKKGTKCYLYFDEKTETAGEQILANYPSVLTRGDFSTTVTNTTTGTIYKSLDETQYDNDGEVYYFAGNPTDNWVQFGGFYWRIVRINGDGSVRLIYSGDSESGPVTRGNSTQIGTSAFNSKNQYSYYSGLVYDTSQHGYGINSTIMEELNLWYINYLKKFEEYLAVSVQFCSDRDVTDGYSWSAEPYFLTYAGNGRLLSNKTPIFKCVNDKDQLSKSNGKLSNPIGLISADEVAFAGGVMTINNTSYYLYTGQMCWTMSPYSFQNMARVFSIGTGGDLDNDYVSVVSGVRPVINLSSDVQITGSGTTSDPYEVQ